MIVLVFGRTLLPSSGTLIFGDDIHRSYYFFIQYLVTSLRQGVIPWWNPYLFSGTPFMSNPITNAFYPVNWLFLVLPGTTVYSLSIMIHLMIAMMGMYILLRKIPNSIRQPADQMPNMGAWVGGLVFGLSGFFMSRIWAGHIDMIASASYLPLVLFMFFRAMNAPSARKIVLAGGVVALQLLAGYHTMAFFTFMAVGIQAAFVSIKRRDFIAFGVVAAGAGVGVGLTAFVLLPIQEFVSLSIRTFPRSYAWSSYGAMTWREMVQLFNPFLYGDQLTYWASPPNYWEHALFIGRVGILMASVGLIATLRNPSRQIIALLALILVIFGLWMSVGPYASVDLQKIAWQFLPMYKYLRIPSRHLLLVTFGLSVLVSIGMSRIAKPFLRYLIVLVLAFEIIVYARHFVSVAGIPESRHDPALIAAVTQGNTLGRLLPNFGVWVPPRDSLDFDSAMEYKIFSATGYDSTLLRNYYEFIDAAGGAMTPSIMEHDVQVPYLDVFSKTTDFLNIKYILVPRGYDPLYAVITDRFTLIREDVARDYRLYENSDASPRFFLTPRLRVVSDRKEAYEAIRTKSIDLLEETLVESKNVPPHALLPDCTAASGKSVIVNRYTPNDILLAVNSPCPSVLTSSEVMYPGWTAAIDGLRVDVFEGNLAFRTVLVPQGTHTVRLQFRPKIFMMGGVISLVTLVASLIAVTKTL